MKKITKILLIILAFFLININVYAEEEEEEETVQNDSYTVNQVSWSKDKNNTGLADHYSNKNNANDNSLGIGYSGIKVSGAAVTGGVASVFKYVLTSNTTGDTILGYCVSPERSIPTDIAFDSKTDLVGRRAGMEKMDAAYAAIISAGCNNKDCEFEDYAATSYALRAVTYMFSGGQAIDGTKSAKAFTCAIYNEAIKWVSSEPDTVSALKELNPNYDVLPSTCNDADVLEYSASGDGAAALNKAKSLFIEGVNAAFDVLATSDSAKGNVSISLSPEITDVSPENTTEKSSELKTYDVDVVITVEDIPAKRGEDGELKNKINIKDIECESCDKYGITFDKIKNADSGEVITEDTNLLELLTENSGYFNSEIHLRVSFTRSDDSECVPQIPFTIDYSYSLPKIKSDYTIGYLTKSSTPGSTEPDPDDDQHFITVDPTNDEKSEDTNVEMEDGKIVFEGDITGIITCTEPDPEEEPPKCDEPTAFINPDCHTDGILEVYAPKNVKDCVLEKSDDTTKNKYELLSSKGGLSNKYCSVYCKEDYNSIYLQNSINEVSCGSGFQIHAQINGTKMCYTAGKGTAGKSGNDKYQINIQQFAQDIYNAQKTMIEAYNAYRRNKAGYDHIKGWQGDCCACTGSPKRTGWEVVGGNFTRYEIVEELVYAEDKPKYGIKQLMVKAVPDNNGDSDYGKATPCQTQKVCAPNLVTGQVVCGIVCVADGVCQNSKLTAAEKKAQYKQAYEAALEVMHAAYRQYEESVKQILDCTLSWTNEYDFLSQAIIKYYYNEHQGEDEYYTPYYDIIRENKSDDEITLEVINDPNYTYSNYEERYWFNDGVLGNGVDDLYKDGGTTDLSSVIREYSFAVCDENKGCSNPKVNISRAAFVRKNLNHVKSYQVPTQFYDIGSTYSKIQYKELEVTDPYEGIPLENELPVTFNACTGGEFDLIIENLGEYYDGDQYGRLIDCQAYDDNGMFKCDPNTEIVVSAYQEKEGKEAFTGRYVCDYNTDCDCEGQGTECDMSYGGTYYMTNENCGEVEIACCDIYAASYDRDTALAKGNKYICTYNDTMYDNYLDAKAACTEIIDANKKYRCPNGDIITSTECTMTAVDLENSSEKGCADANYHIKKTPLGAICVAEPIEDLSTCTDGYRNIGNGRCERLHDINATNGLSDIAVGTIIGECETVDGGKISYAEISKKYTCETKACDTSKGGIYKQKNTTDPNIKYDCINMACCTDDVCIHKEDGVDKYYLKSKLTKAKENDKDCEYIEKEHCEVKPNNINYYYYSESLEKNICVPACEDYDGTYLDSAGKAYPSGLGLKTIASSGKTKSQLCPTPTDDECLETYKGTYAFEQNGKFTCPSIKCCYAGDGNYQKCLDSNDGEYNYNSFSEGPLTQSRVKELCGGGNGVCDNEKNFIDYYYYESSLKKNICVPACEDSGKLYALDGTVYSNSLGLQTVASSGKTKAQLCPDIPNECLEKYEGTYAFTIDGKVTCPEIKCCYDSDNTYKPCWDKDEKIIYDFNSLNGPLTDSEKENVCGDTCKTKYSGYYYEASRGAGNYECYNIECCTDNLGNENICKTNNGGQKFRKDLTKVTNYETQCQSSVCVEDDYKGTYRYENTTTCFDVKCCDEKTGLCEAVAGNKVDKNTIVKVTNKETECKNIDTCSDEYGGRYAIPKCEGECLECVEIKCCESNKANAICHDAAGNTYNRSGITYIGDDGTCQPSCPDDCGGDCTPGDEDCPDPDCPKCKIKCGPDGCIIVTTEDECPLCDFKCFNCIFNNGSFNLTTKQISTTVMNDIAKNSGSTEPGEEGNAANRQYGYNWITSSHLSELNVPDELKEKMARITDKATETITQIGEAGETIYGEKDADSSALNFSIEMTPGITDYLRNYNREHIDDGGYGNESLKCYHEMEDDKVKYQYIYCFSEVIDELTEKYGNKVTISDKRVVGEDSRKANANSKNYWELWDEKVYSENAIGGPAWR